MLQSNFGGSENRTIMARFILIIVLAVVVTLAFAIDIPLIEYKSLGEESRQCFTCMRLKILKKPYIEAGTKCSGEACKDFWIFSHDFWIDSGRLKPDLKTYGSASDENSYQDFAECANNLICSLNTIESYMEKFAKDCDGDGEITCTDRLLLVQHGYKDCTNHKLSYEAWSSLLSCLNERGVPN